MKFLLVLSSLMVCSLSNAFTDSTIYTKTFLSNDAAPYLHAIVDLCNRVFSEYPELYEAQDEYTEIIAKYIQSSSGVATIIFNDTQPVGVAIGSALTDKKDHYDEAMLQENGINPDDFFYLGEIVLLKEYRGKGYGKQVYQEFEEAVKNLNHFSALIFCKLHQSAHPELQPADYHSLNTFWSKQGYTQHPTLMIPFHWRDNISHEIMDHPMEVWFKPLL